MSKFPVSYATISFGNGQGIFADNNGYFVFNTKLYSDVDSLYVSALGFKNKTIPINILNDTIALQPQASELDEVVITSAKNNTKRKFKTKTLKPYLDDEYFNCWLPTIASEIAVFFKKPDAETTQQLSEVIFPIALESKNWKKRKQSNSNKKGFSTLFKVNFYNAKNGYPSTPLHHQTVVFIATEKHGDSYTLNVNDLNITIPQAGFFVSLQVLGYTDKQGKLLPNKKYKEVKYGNRIVKIPTNFRPLLPFTNEISSKNTFVKRIFIQNNAWLRFDKKSGIKSTLLQKGLYNYGVGISYKTFKD